MNFEVAPKASPEDEPESNGSIESASEQSIDDLIGTYEEDISGYNAEELESEIGSLIGFIMENEESAIDNPACAAVIDAHRRKVMIAETLLDKAKGSPSHSNEEDGFQQAA